MPLRDRPCCRLESSRLDAGSGTVPGSAVDAGFLLRCGCGPATGIGRAQRGGERGFPVAEHPTPTPRL